MLMGLNKESLWVILKSINLRSAITRESLSVVLTLIGLREVLVLPNVTFTFPGGIHLPNHTLAVCEF